MLKKGDLVEIIGCSDTRFSKFVGERFILSEVTVLSTGELRGSVGWRSPFRIEGCRFSPIEKYLRKVNPDGDELSNESFNEIMNKLKNTLTVRI